MSRRYITMGACLLSASTLPAQSATDSVRRLDSLWARMYVTSDTMTAKSLFATNIVVTSSAGASRTREQELDDVRPTPGVAIHAFRTRNVDINMQGSNAVLIGECEYDITANGQRSRPARRYTATYARGGPLGWQMIALHFFPAPAVSGPMAPPAGTGVEGRWEGALGSGGGRLRLALDVTKASDGLLFATLTSIDQGGGQIPVQRVTQTGDSVHVEIPAIQGRYDAVLSADRTQLIGTFNQGRATPLTLSRTGSVTAPSSATPSAPPSPLGLFIDVTVPARPAAFSGGGKSHLIYELDITNATGGDLALTRIEVLKGNETIATYEGSALNGILQQPRRNVTDSRLVPAGVRATAFIQVTLDSGMATPASIRHRVTAGSQTVETSDVGVQTVRPIVVGAPFRGADWRAANGPGNTSGHRRAAIPINGRVAIAQRFAIDWVKVGANGATFAGDPLNNKSYHAYGVEILAVADGIVSAIKDGIPENIPGATSRAVPITLETVGGNHVVQDLGGGRYAFYAHLVPGSLRVKPGQRVKKGQVIGLLGNSGNSTEPHLHFHIMDGTSPLGSQGLPYLIDVWEIQTAPGVWERRVNQLPMMDARTRFAAPTPGTSTRKP